MADDLEPPEDNGGGTLLVAGDRLSFLGWKPLRSDLVVMMKS